MDLLELFGRRYVIDHCISQLKKFSEDEIFRIYITDALKAIANNTGKLTSGGVGMAKRFSELIVHTDNQNTDKAEIKAEKIKMRIKNVLRKLGKGDA